MKNNTIFTDLNKLDELISHVNMNDANNMIIHRAYSNTKKASKCNNENEFIDSFLSNIALSCSYYDYDDYKTTHDNYNIDDIITLLQTVSMYDVIAYRPDLLININKHTHNKANEYSDYWSDNYGRHILTDGSHDDLLIMKTAFIICEPDYDSMMYSKKCLQKWFNDSDASDSIRLLAHIIIDYHGSMMSNSINTVKSIMQAPYDFNIDSIDFLQYSIRMSLNWNDSLKMHLLRMIANGNTDINVLRMQTWAVMLAVFFNDNEYKYSLNSCLHYNADILINSLKQVYPMRMMPFETQYEAFKTYLINNSDNE